MSILKTDYIQFGEDLYEIVPPTPTETDRGGIIASPKRESDVIEARLGDDGKLYVGSMDADLSNYYNKDEVDEIIETIKEGFNGSSTFIANITMNDDGSLSADKTFEELWRVYEDGFDITFIYNNSQYCKPHQFFDDGRKKYIEVVVISNENYIWLRLKEDNTVSAVLTDLITKNNLLQTAGDSIVLPMSQKAVTNAINELQANTSQVQIITWEADD